MVNHRLNIQDLSEELEKLRRQIDQQACELAELKLSRIHRMRRGLARNYRVIRASLLCFVLVPIAVSAFTTPNTFTAGTPAVAADVNANFTAIKNQFDAMENKSWRLVYETNVGANSTSISATGLDGNVDRSYQVIARFVNASGANCNYYIQPNGDASLTYGQQYIAATGNVLSGNTTPGVQGMHIGNALGSQSTEMSGIMYAVAGAQRIFHAIETNLIGTGSIGNVQTMTSSWNNSATNLTSMTFVASQTNGIGAGSHIEIWARR